ncbi:MAG: phosphatidate cytidylyltransferase, partial [Elusimicrobiales bacterium]|nr:phosphatidate cytidylyltransferase [Elusimicrobiales bacterium]
VLAAIHLGGAPYLAFIALVIALALYEYGLILWTGGRKVQRIPLVVFGLFMALIAVLERIPLNQPQADHLLPLAINAVILGVVLWEVFSPGRSLERLAFTFFGVFFIPWSLAHLVNIRDIRPNGEYLTYMLFITVWCADTAAYFAGKTWGRHKLAEEISPKKTWEGALAGFVCAIVLSLVIRGLLMPDMMSVPLALALGALAGTVGQLSDLAESIIKRSVGVKDSSSLLPGHGGVLDRFDSYLLLAPVYYYTALFVGMSLK